MINLWLRGCLRVRSSSIKLIICKPLPSSFDTRRCFCSQEIGKQLAKIDKNKEIKGYFQEDFNVKGTIYWEFSTKAIAAAIIYVTASMTAAAVSFYVMNTDFTLDLVVELNLMEFLEFLNLSVDSNPKKLLTITLYLLTEPLRILLAYRQCSRFRNFLYKRKLIRDPKMRRFKGEKNYDEEKIGRF